MTFFTALAIATSFAWLGVEDPAKWHSAAALYILNCECRQLTGWPERTSHSRQFRTDSHFVSGVHNFLDCRFPAIVQELARDARVIYEAFERRDHVRSLSVSVLVYRSRPVQLDSNGICHCLFGQSGRTRQTRHFVTKSSIECIIRHPVARRVDFPGFPCWNSLCSQVSHLTCTPRKESSAGTWARGLACGE